MALVQDRFQQAGTALPVTAIAIYEGYLYKWSSNQMAVCTNVTDTVVGIAAYSTKDADGDAKTMTAGDKVNFFLLGSGLEVNVAMAASEALTTGCTIYNGQTAGTDGHASIDNSNSATAIGHYYGDAQTTSSTAGTLYPVTLDIFP
jgi:hypothetical protein